MTDVLCAECGKLVLRLGPGERVIDSTQVFHRECAEAQAKREGREFKPVPMRTVPR